MSKPDTPERKPQESVIPPWLLRGLKSRRTIKTWLRCCIVLACAMILMVNKKTLTNMGQAGFFVAIVAVMLPPFLPASLYSFLLITVIVGMLIGWAWSAAAMASALNVRSPSLLLHQQQQLKASIVQGIPVATQTQIFLFHGGFLDPRSSAVYGVFLFIGTYFTGLMRAFLPKLAICAIFSTIVIDVMCSYGPLFPTAQYTLAKMFLIPTVYYAAMALTSLILIFPESMNHSWLTTLNEGVLSPILVLLQTQSTALETSPTDDKTWPELTQKSMGTRRGLYPSVTGLVDQVGFVDLEISIGRLGPSDIKRISKGLKVLTTRASGLLTFQFSLHELSKIGKTTPTAGRFTTYVQRVQEKEKKLGHDLEALMPILREASANLRTECEDSLQALISWVQECNGRRWTQFLSGVNKAKIAARHDVLFSCLTALETATAQFKKSERSQLLEPFKQHFHPETGELIDSSVGKPAARSLFLCFVFADTLVAFSEELQKLVQTAVDLDEKRIKPRVWFPSGLGNIIRKVTDGESTAHLDSVAMGTSSDPTKFTEKQNFSGSDFSDEESDVEPNYRKARNPDALPPTSIFGRFFIALGSFMRFFRSDESIFALRQAVVSVALWIPQVCTSSAWFTYSNRGLWAMIMAQTGLAVYAGDQIASFFLRIAGTVAGLLVGAAVWYIGAGRGNGNPYGIVIATTVFIAPMIFIRLVSPPQQLYFWILAGVTVVFVVGYSWVDMHIVQVSNAGKGIALGWKRALLVIIGFTAGFIVMLFPRPSSSRILVRKTIAAAMEEFSSMFAAEVEGFLAEERHARGSGPEKSRGNNDEAFMRQKELRAQALGRKLLDAGNRLITVAPSLTTAKFEPALQGEWPAELYQRLHETQANMLFYISLLAGALSRMDSKWCEVLIYKTPFLNPNFLPDVFATLTILANSLRFSQPLPGSLPRLKDRLIYHDRYLAAQNPDSRNGSPATKQDFISPPSATNSDAESEMDVMELEALAGTGNVDATQVGVKKMTFKVLEDDHLPVHSTAVIALANIFRLIDESADIVRTLCGETSFSGFDSLRDEFLKREEIVFGDRTR